MVVTLSEIDAQLAEIDENLVRHELNALEHSEQTLKRKELYEAKHPQTKAGVSGGQSGSRSKNKITTVESTVMRISS